MTASLRPGLALSQSVLSRCDGSAKFTFGPTTVIASLTGPLEIRVRDEQLDAATLQVSALPLRGLPSPAMKALSYTIRLILTSLLDLRKHPRSLLQLTLQTLSAPSMKYNKPFKTFTEFGGEEEKEEEEERREERSCVEYAASLNAAMVACLDAGLDMKGVAVAVGIAYDGHKGLILDPTPEMESEAEVCFVLGFSFGHAVGGAEGEMVWCEMSGAGKASHWDEQILTDAIVLGKTAAQHVLAFIRKSMQSKYQNHVVKIEPEDVTMD